MLKGLVCRAAWIGAVLVGSAALAAQPPVVPGYNRLKDEGKATPAQLGQVLLGELNCTQCHTAPTAKRVLGKGAPDLSDAGAHLTPQYLTQYLLEPHATKPGTTMPDLFHASEPHAKSGAVEFLVQYLVSLGGPIKPARGEGNTLMVEQGRRLYQSVGCVACHAPEQGTQLKAPSVPLPNLAEKTTIDKLEAFLLDPLKDRPAGRMPNLGLSREEAHAISVYLLRDQLTNPLAATAPLAKPHGLEFNYYTWQTNNVALENVGKHKPKTKGTISRFTLDIPGRRNDHFVVKYSGAITIPRDGKYTFYLNSDDGSRLYLDSKLLIDNDGEHSQAEKVGDIELLAGEHAIDVTYFQSGGDAALKVEWAGPNIDRHEVPTDVLSHTGGRPMVPTDGGQFTLDPQKAEMGGRMFAMLGCASCHNTIPNVKSVRGARPLYDMDVNSDTGCLGSHVGRGLPNYDLNDDQRQAIKAAIQDRSDLEKPFEPAEQVIHTMAAMNCFACHNRQGVGGPTPDRSSYFTMTSTFDMGDEGRIPPALTYVGSKLLPDAMRQIIFEGKLHVRPVMSTRMPIWSTQALGSIVDAFQKADSTAKPPEPPKFSAQAVVDGRQLVGVRGLGCVNCHGMNGVSSLGMPGPDLGTVHDRIKFGWFHQWLDNPPSLVPGTRMPQFWPGHEAAYKDVAGGTEEGQIGVIWTYLSLGRSMALPAGLVPSGGFELVPSDTPIVHRTFMAGVGPRAIAVGFPEMVHVAFDANGVKLVEAWRGKFFDARGMWGGRGGESLGPLGTDLIKMPPGPSFAFLEHSDSPWPKIPEPVIDEKYRNIGGRFKGYELDKQERPTFHYILDDVDIHEQPLPVLKPTRAELIRRFTLNAKQPVKDLYFIAAAGDKIEPKSPGVWAVDDGKLVITISSSEKLEAAVRGSDGHQQLLIPIQLINGAAAFDVEMSW